MALKTNYKDAAWSGDRLFKIASAGSDKVTISDVTSYTVSGDSFGASDINATNKAVNGLTDDMATLKKSVSDGKALVAAAITAKKVAATVSDSFATLAEKIGKIVLGSGNAVAADVLKGKTFTNSGGVELTGSMPDHSTKDSLGGINSNYPNVPIHKGTQGQFCTPTASSERLFAIRPDKGYWNGDTYAAAPATSKTVTPLTTQQVVSPASGGVLEKVVVGAIPNQKNYGYGGFGQGDGYYSINALPEGYYRKMSGGNWEPEARISKDTLRSALGITADKIKKGAVIAGITGTWEGYVAGSGDLYNKGALGLGGGFFTVPYYVDGESEGAAWYTKVAGTLYYDTAQMRVEGHTLWLASNQTVNLSAYSQLNITLKVNKSSNLRILATYNKPVGGSSSSNNIAVSEYVTGSQNTTRTISLDVSKINANCYILFGWSSAASDADAKMIVDRVWLS